MGLPTAQAWAKAPCGEKPAALRQEAAGSWKSGEAANSLECGVDAVTETQHGETTDLDYGKNKNNLEGGATAACNLKGGATAACDMKGCATADCDLEGGCVVAASGPF
eukprot:COSAG06_NODE_1667_length_8758_cov_5.455133_2_plen_108_part_00